MSVMKPRNFEQPRMLLPGDKVIIIKSCKHENMNEGLFGNSGSDIENVSDYFQGTVKTIPEQAGEHKGFWEIKDVEGMYFGSGAVRECVDLIFDSNDMSFSIYRVDLDPPKEQYKLRIDQEGMLQL